jgi:Ser/Thr protein kinase RdoA (MazF antagonist)
MPEEFDLREIASHFQLDGQLVSANRFGSGHINDTFLVNVAGNPDASSFILQRIDHFVFGDPTGMMENISRVTDHLRNKKAKCLRLIPTVDEQTYYNSPDDEYWRVYEFVSGAVTYDKVPSTTQARVAAAMFGGFQELLADLPGQRLNETIPDFHNTPARYSQFHDAVKKDACNRVRHCSREIDQALAWEMDAGTLVGLYESGQIPERITHNDTKLNNLLFDQTSGGPICVIDLDTVMPGIALYDFGDMVRTATSPTDEDTTDLSRVGLRLPYYEALVEGFVGATSAFLTEAETGHLSMSGKIITIEIGLRFLTDYLSGDRYFGSQRPAHNLDRARAQFALAASIEKRFDEMQSIVNRVTNRQKLSSGS